MADQTMAALKKQRSTNKAKLTNLVKFAKQDHALTDSTELTTRLRRADQLLEEFTALEMRIFTEDPKEESDFTYEENYYTAVSSLNAWIRSKNLTQGVINLDSTVNDTQTGDYSKVKLPKLHIPSFSGDYSEWQSFYDLFTSTIHESPSLSTVQKFQYLKGLLRGEAAILLRHISVTEGNYIGALNKLKDRYDRKRHIINTFIRTFVEQPAIQNSTAFNMRRLMDTSDEVIRGLRALGDIAETRDPWLIYLLLQKLDDKSKALWAEYSAELTNPEFSEFLKFLSRRIDTLESISSSSKRSIPRSEIKSHVVAENSEAQVESHAGVRPINNYQCAMCQEKGHSIFRCNQFQTLNVNERKQFVKRTNRCFNCFSSSHPIFRCTAKGRCQKCGQKHNTLLHQEEIPGSSKENLPTSSEILQANYSDNTSTYAILPTAIVNTIDFSGKITQCRALLDSGSQASFITESCAQRLRLVKRNARITVSGLGQSNSGISKGLVTITLKPELLPEFSIDALVMSKITSKIPTRNLKIDMRSYSGFKLADPHFNKTNHIDLLIGADHFFNILQTGQIKTHPHQPILQNTIFGWIVSGQSANCKDGDLVSMVATSNQNNEEINLDRTLRRFWELESINNQQNILSPEEALCENHFISTVKRNPEGRFMVKLPFKQPPENLGESLPTAIQRFRGIERRFSRDPTFANLYREFMAEYQQLKHMVEVPPPQAAENHFYLPHHGVFKTTNGSSKIRVVFDGSSKSSTGISLNNCLAVGPIVQSSLYAIVLRFREHNIVISADVEKMYRQVAVSPEDTRYQRIVWRPDVSEPIRHYQLTTVTYGLASASFLATRSLKKIADNIQNTEPGASQVISRDIYVDDLMTGADNIDEAVQLQQRVSDMLTAYGFHLRKWKSNSPEVLRHIPHELQEFNHKEIISHNGQCTESTKVLGINWNSKTDHFTFSSDLPKISKITKRTVLSEASRLFDPMGWLSPIIISFKIFLQLLWADNLQWDDPLPEDKLAIWNKLITNLKSVNQISIPRFLNTTKNCIIDIHGFCDASQSAYAAVVYFRTITLDGRVFTELVSAKTKVAPMKQQTLPRLELCAAVLVASLIKLVKRESNLTINEIYAWTDSRIVLDWLSSHPKRWSTFVGNRTAEILDTLSRKNWKHVPSAENPADCASRGLSPMELKSHKIWWNGPSFVSKSPEHWPAQAQNYGNNEEKSNKIMTFTLMCTKSNEWLEELIHKYSSFRKLQRVLCYILRFINNTTKTKESRIIGVLLRRDELLHVMKIVCRHDQQQYYKEDILALQSKKNLTKQSSLKSLYPFLDDFGLLRVGGRLQNSSVPYSTKHPIVLHPKSTITRLILRDCHLDNKHAGPSLLLSITRQQYWIPNGKTKAKEIVRQCITCTKFKAECQTQLMGNLPKSRVELVRPFLRTGVDYAGPISIHLTKGRGQKTYKAYICLFVCLSIKAIHLELVTDLSSDAFLAALKRFTARRGICSELHSDNGTNFVGADSKLRDGFAKIIKKSNNISDYLSRLCITWNFIPPNSPHFGGLWEAAIKSTKFHVKRVIGQHILTLEEMSTLLAEIEAILNSRPLCASDDFELDPLTPSHFLIGHPYTKIPELDITHLKESYLSRWQMVQQMSQHFWKRWYVEYLTSLQQRTKWQTGASSIQIDDIVLIKDNNLPVNQWLLGKVIGLHPGSDGLVRVVTLKTRSNEIKRPIHKLCLLPISQRHHVPE